MTQSEKKASVSLQTARLVYVASMTLSLAITVLAVVQAAAGVLS